MFNFDLIIGNEAVDFQVNSKLGRMLTECFKEVQDYKESLDYSDIPNITDAKRTYRIEKVYDFVKKVTMPKFGKIILECCNLYIKKFFCVGGKDRGLCGAYAVLINISDLNEMFEIISRSSGSCGYVAGDTEKAKKDVADVATMATTFNAFDSKLNTRVFGKSNRPIYVPAMYFDANMSFLADDFVSEGVCEPLTPEEVAGVVMHEIGHAMSTIEHAADLYFMKSRVQEIKLNLKNSKLNDDELQETLEQLDTKFTSKVRSLVEDADLSGAEGAVTKERLLSMVDSCHQLIVNVTKHKKNKSDKKGDDSIIATVFGTLIGLTTTLFVSIFILILTIFMSILMILTGFLVIAELEKRCTDRNRNWRGEKLSDVGANRNRAFVIERWADEFVARHGYGQYLTSALNKFDTLVDHDAINGITDSTSLRNSTIGQIMISIVLKLLSFADIFSWFDPAIYENQYRRALRVAQDTYAFFKASDKAPKDVVVAWMNKVKEIENNVNAAKRVRDTKAGQAAINIFQSLTNPVKWYAYLNNGNIIQDLQVLEDNLDDLSSNKLFYLSDKLKYK